MARTKKKTNKEMLVWGIQHIAENHNCKAVLDYLETEHQVCVMNNNVPTLSDVYSLCADLEIPRCNVYTTMFGVDIEIPEDWFTRKANKKFNGMCFWKRAEVLV